MQPLFCFEIPSETLQMRLSAQHVPFARRNTGPPQKVMTIVAQEVSAGQSAVLRLLPCLKAPATETCLKPAKMP
jgi:hypothetical protein